MLTRRVEDEHDVLSVGDRASGVWRTASSRRDDAPVPAVENDAITAEIGAGSSTIVISATW